MKIKNIYLVITLVVTGIFFSLIGMVLLPETGQADEPSPVTTVVIEDEGGFTKAVSTIASLLTPTVVHIDVSGTVVQSTYDFRDFFNPPQRREYEVPVRALGSGVLISEAGHIITNNHVVQNADTIEVELHDGSRKTAKLVGRDPSTDLAVVKIDPTPDMKYAQLGNSDDIQVGEWVIAIGSPRGLDWTVTAGIISAKNRRNLGVLGPSGYEDFIQTDASINPGNSGGPLINLNGEVVGINSLIVSASQGSDGLGFAIPSNMVKAISDSLIKHGKVIRGYMGVNVQDITHEMSLKLEENFKGVIIADLVPGGPAEKAGLMQGDIVVRFDEEAIENSTQLRNRVAATGPGKQIKVDILRDNKNLDITVRIGDLEKAQKLAKASQTVDPLGLSVEEVTQDIARRIGLRKATGVIITDVEQGSASDQAGLDKGDIIFRVGNREIDSPDEFSAVVATAAEAGSVMLLLRDGRTGRIGYVVVGIG
ncbi:MAG: Do family serine endopeptidase [Spirochaetota bacterium]|nr:MAG: Do family serine endopeptidase [Spirochaetota bacterium]